MRLRTVSLFAALLLACTHALWPNQFPANSTGQPRLAQEGTVTLPNFRFGTGETLPELKLHYLTLGSPHRNAAGHVDNAILLLHGTGGNAHSLLNPVFSDVLFVPGGMLDITKYFIILPDDIGHGAKLQAVRRPAHALSRLRLRRHGAQPARMMLDEMKVDHLRLILGTSMGCMQTFVWGETYPGFSDALAPFACLPVQIAGRNRMMRYMAIEGIKLDPAWKDGDYNTEPVEGIRWLTTHASGHGFCSSGDAESRPPRARRPSNMSIATGRALARRCERHDLLPQRQPEL